MENNNFNQFDQQGQYNQPMSNMPPQEEKANVGLAILSFFIPLAGLIIFIKNKDKKPKTAKVCGICALVCVILIILSSFIGGNSDDNDVNSVTPSETVSQQISSGDVTTEEATTKETTTAENIPIEYKSALKKAKIYSDTMYMSKAAIYDQLTSEYGEQFSAEAAQYAMDNLEADWKENALKKAKTYQNDMAMSPSAIRDQLTSEYGEKFTSEEADYAIENLDK